MKLRSETTALIIFALALLLLPWLGQTLFNTKGEPREAIVAMSMIQSGDWILPVSYGSDIPYKPPLLAWLIAIFSEIFNSGTVCEYTSRLPSALAAMSMVMCGFFWARREKGTLTACTMAIVTICSFEVMRAAVACRVDMVLTACMVCPLYLMYRWRHTRRIHLLIFSTLLLSGAVLTKGPVGSLLPCLAMGIFCLVRRDRFFTTILWLGAICIASMILPAIWYYAAWQRGGSEFFDLAWEENIGRLTGTMSYQSHVNPWYYNIITVVSGMLPWTLFCLIAVCAVKWRSIIPGLRNRRLSEASAFMLTVAATVFIFYCIPSSKRSVYLLPMYPAMAYGVAIWMIRMQHNASLRIFAIIICILAMVAPVAATAMQWIPMKHMPIQPIPWWRYTFVVLCIITGYISLTIARHHRQTLEASLFATFALVLTYLAVFQPMFLNAKSDAPAAAAIEQAANDTGPVYSLIDDSMLRYYTLNFYLGDRLRTLGSDTLPSEGGFCIITSDHLLPRLSQYTTLQPADTTRIIARSCDTRRPVILARYPHTE